MSLTRAEALDLLPLLAGDDLEQEQQAAVEAAVADDAELRAELAAYQQLDGWLADALGEDEAEAPGWVAALGAGAADPAGDSTGSSVDSSDGAVAESAPVAEASVEAEAHVEEASDAPAAPLLIRRQCPFCHDALGALAVVFCTGCATPHHEACFAENEGCALLGCGATASVHTREAASKVCTGCQGHTPADAPFCAWCGTPMGGDAVPRHQRRRAAAPPLSLGRFLAAAALLLVTGVGVGALFGRRERPVIESMRAQALALSRNRAEAAAREALQLIVRAQRAFRDQDLDDDGGANFAADLTDLREAGAAADLGSWLARAREFEVTVHGSADGARFCATAEPTPESQAYWGENPSWDGPLPTLFVDQDGLVRRVGHDDRLDVEGCRLHEGGSQ
jgi:hypothetical protein